MSPLKPLEIGHLLRFASLFSVSAQAAEELVVRAFQDVLPFIEPDENRREVRMDLFEAIWRLRDPTRGNSLAPAFLADFSPVQQAGCGLSWLEKFSPAEIAEICGITTGNLKELLPRLSASASESVRNMPVDAAALERLALLAGQLTKTPPAHFSLLSPVGLSLVFALLALAAVFGWSMLHDNPYDELPLTKALLDQAENITTQNLEAVDVPAGDLVDWLFLKHGLDNVHIPELFAPLQAAFCGVDRVERHPVAQIVLKESKALLFICRAADFDLPETHPGEWSVFTQGEWTVAVQVQNGAGWFLIMPGTEDDLRTFLDQPR